MKTLLFAATALALSGSALAQDRNETNQSSIPGGDVSIAAPLAVVMERYAESRPNWTPEQRALWQQHIAFVPSTWTPTQRTMFQEMLTISPAQWSAEQRALWALHYNSFPTTWTAEQRAMYMQQIAHLERPWLASDMAASGRIVQPSNADPEHDARGIAVISDPAFVPAGFNGVPAAAVGGPAEGDDFSYPACTATVTDNCIQLYERGVRASGMGGPVEGEDEAGDNTAEDDGLDVDVNSKGNLDVDGDLDGDGDNDIE